MIRYDSNLKIKDALEIYFSKYHFADGGYNLKYFRIKLGKAFIPVPNIPTRVKAVKFHDVHHIVTGYEANYRGEAEIGGWEIASGCGKHYVAWVLNFGSFLIGMFLYPKQLYHAFMRGRKCNANLYFDTMYNDELLNKTVGELRAKIGVDNSQQNSVSDFLLFMLCGLVALMPYFLFFLLIFLLFI